MKQKTGGQTDSCRGTFIIPLPLNSLDEMGKPSLESEVVALVFSEEECVWCVASASDRPTISSIKAALCSIVTISRGFYTEILISVRFVYCSSSLISCRRESESIFRPNCLARFFIAGKAGCIREPRFLARIITFRWMQFSSVSSSGFHPFKSSKMSI